LRDTDHAEGEPAPPPRGYGFDGTLNCAHQLPQLRSGRLVQTRPCGCEEREDAPA
jgi:hypothetical protein